MSSIEQQSIQPIKSSLATASLILGILSFVPGIGLILGIIAIIIGIVSLFRIRKNRLRGKKLAIAGIILGFLGIITISLTYGLLMRFLFSPKTLQEEKSQLSQQILTQNAGALELYKNKYGRYPETLQESTQAGFIIFPADHYLKPFHYEVSSNGQSYELRSLGPDGIYGTQDDILPFR